jgi:hypothetical protein
VPDIWDLEYGDDGLGFEDVIEYVGPEEQRRQVEREIARLMERFIRGAAVKVDWEKAECIRAVAEDGVSPDIWHCPGDTQPSAIAADYCFACPIRLDCLKYACASGERHGMWGGVPENIRAGKGEGADRNISAYDYPSLAELPNVYNVTSRKYRYHRGRLKEWTPGQEYNDENFVKWQTSGPTRGSAGKSSTTAPVRKSHPADGTET